MAVDTTPIEAIYDKLNQVTAFHPASTEIFDDFLQEAGDIVTMFSGTASFDFPIFAQHMTWTGSMLTTMESTGNKQRNALPPLQRRQKNGSYGAGQRVTEQGVIYETELIKTNKVIGMEAKAMGVLLDENGNPVVDPNNPDEFVWDTTSSTGAKIYSNLSLTANRASLISAINDVSGTQISGSKIDLSAQGTVLIQAINNRDPSQTSVVIQASKIDLQGVVTSTQMDTRLLNADALFATTGYTGTIYTNGLSAASGEVSDLTVGTFRIRNTPSSTATVTRKGVKIGNGAVSDSLLLLGTGSDSNLQIPNAVTHFGSSSASGGTISIPYYTYDSGGGQAAGNITFNIADTAYYQSHIGIASTGSWEWDAEAGGGDGAYVRVITPNAGSTATISFPEVSAQATISYNSSTHKYTALAVAKYGGRDVSALDSDTSGTEAYTAGVNSVSLQNSKSVTLSSSGTITPDSGYVAMKQVSVTISGGGGYTPADIRIGNISYYSSLPSGGTTLDTLATSIHANKGKSGYVRIVADLEGYTGTPKYYYIPMSGI